MVVCLDLSLSFLLLLARVTAKDVYVSEGDVYVSVYEWFLYACTSVLIILIVLMTIGMMSAIATYGAVITIINVPSSLL